MGGLNDSEEMNLGGFGTDPWKADTDGDLWSDGYETLTKGTNPLAGDTDGDGARDSSDLWQKIGAAASAVVNSLVQVGQMVYKGLVALGTFLVNLAEAIVDWGMKALGALWNTIVGVTKPNTVSK